jgi:tetratricopeptide (TPR) repeat protein
MAALEKKQTDGPAYRAFISYSHSDKTIAKWLHSELERYRLPKKLIGNHTALGPVPKRLSPIFRDVDELPASGNLGTELQDALTRSLFLIVICSPASARSKWVNEEIRQFKLMHGANKVLALIVDGVPNASANTIEQECFAPALKFDVAPSGVLTDVPSEPIAADLRKSADGKRLAKLKLISGLTGLRLDDLVQREAARRIRILVQVSLVSLVAALFAVGLAVYANDRRLEADAQRTIAEQESATARAVSNFLVKTFASGNSLQENPNTITARSILDRGAQRLTKELHDQPLVQSRLSATIALAYNNLGLFNQAIDVVDATAELSGLENPAAFVIKAEALRRKGDLDASMEAAKYAQDLAARKHLRDFDRDSAETSADVARLQALIYYKRGQYDAGLEAFAHALHELENMAKPDELEIAKILQNRALLLSDVGDMTQAAADLERAKTLVQKSVGPQDILLGQIALAQAQVNFLSGNLEPALDQIKTAIAIMQGILEGDNPTLADALSMQGQILHAMGTLDEAKKALTQAVQIYTKAYGGRHYLSGIAEVYLGLIAGDQHDLPAALAHFDEAKLHYDASYGEVHANHGDLLVNRATVLASAGDMVRANQDCEEGIRILAATLGGKAAFTQQLQAVCNELKIHM